MADITKDTITALRDILATHVPPIVDSDGRTHVLSPAGYGLSIVEPPEKKLHRIRQRPTFFDVDSFVAYVKRYQTAATQVFATPGHSADNGKASITAIIDYHGSASEAGDAGTPDYCAHVATYRPRYSEEWTRWCKAATLGQVEFAEFLEENRRDISAPEAASLLDIVTKFRASRKQSYDSVVYQPNGDVQIAYAETTESAGKPGVSVPTEIKLGIPVFFKGQRYEVPVFLRYKVGDSKVQFSIKVDRADYIEQAAFDEITSAVGEALALPIYFGTP